MGLHRSAQLGCVNLFLGIGRGTGQSFGGTLNSSRARACTSHAWWLKLTKFYAYTNNYLPVQYPRFLNKVSKLRLVAIVQT